MDAYRGKIVNSSDRHTYHDSSRTLVIYRSCQAWGAKYWPDLLVTICFIIVAVLYYQYRTGHDKVITNLVGDAPMIASVFAGRDYRVDFEGDPLLGQAKTTDPYIAAAYWYVSFLRRWFQLPYGNAYLTMLLPITFLQLLGFYILGRVLCQSRILSVLLAVFCTVFIQFESWGEYWGLDREPLNRVAIGALMGFFWTMAVYYGRKPKMRLAIMAAVGSSLWIHPVATPVLGFFLWLSLWTTRAEDETQKKFIINMCMAAGMFLLILIPYALQYWSRFGHQDSPPELQKKLFEIMRVGYINGYFRNEWDVIKKFFYEFGWQKPFLSAAAIMLIASFSLSNSKDRRTVLQLGLMAMGILIISDIVFLLDHSLAARADRIPTQADLVRGNRFLIPLSFVVLFYSSTVLSHRFGLKVGAPISIIIVAFLFFNLQPNLKKFSDDLRQGYRVMMSKESPANEADVEMLSWLHEKTPRKTSVTVFFTNLLDNTIRYVALRPLKFSYKDSCFFNYFDGERALEYVKKRAAYTLAIEQKDKKVLFHHAAKTAMLFGSDLVVIDKGLIDTSYQKLNHAIAWENVKYVVIDLRRISSSFKSAIAKI